MAVENEQSNLFFQTVKTEVGILKVRACDTHIMSVSFIEQKEETSELPNALTWECIQQLQAYFDNQLEIFDLPLSFKGTSFQKTVWQALQEIPFGKTVSYLTLARSIGNEKAIRAVGHANGHNPFPIIIPCHRVIGHNGRLVGYSGGLWRKKWLLRHEKSMIQSELVFSVEY